MVFSPLSSGIVFCSANFVGIEFVATSSRVGKRSRLEEFNSRSISMSGASLFFSKWWKQRETISQRLGASFIESGPSSSWTYSSHSIQRKTRQSRYNLSSSLHGKSIHFTCHCSTTRGQAVHQMSSL